MNKLRKSGRKCRRAEDNRKLLDTEEAPVTKSMKVEVENGDSPQRSHDARVSSHSTPISKIDYSSNMEDSAELDYRCSPILLPCTQDGGNEIAWDWQCSFGKSTNDRTKSQGCNFDTPKRAKILQKKRDPNSPLLQKPFKRKQVKMENIEDIGKFTAELKALSEKMNNMQQNCQSLKTEKDCELNCEPDTQLVVELDSGDESEIMSKVFVKEDTKCGIAVANTSNKKISSYEDLFDDSIEECMVRCSQEVEEKLNLIEGKRNDLPRLPVVEEKSGLSFMKEENHQNSPTYNYTTETSKSCNTSKNASTHNTSSYLKTYSKNSSKTSSTSSIHTSNPKEQALQKSYLNNNVITSYNESAAVRKEPNLGLFEMPDDSFDDCLATCLEDAKFMSQLFELDDVFSDASQNAKTFDKLYKQTSPATTESRHPKKLVSKGLPFSYSSKPSGADSSTHLDYKSSKSNKSPLPRDPSEGSSSTAMESRKFFKTKSLSDQYRGTGRNPSAGVNSKASMSANCIANSVPSSDSHASFAGSFVSNTYPVTCRKPYVAADRFPSSNPVDVTHPPNRSVGGNGAGTCMIKHKSASDIRARDSGPVRCTPQEIERKRLEAKMRLEAKRKLQQSAKVKR